jgi:thioredoxin 1
MKLRSHYALILLLSSAAPYPFIKAESQEHRSRTGAAIEITSLAQLQSILANNPNVVVDFYASWCGPCQRMLPIFGQLATSLQDKNIVFVKVNVDIAGNTYGIKMLPTIVCFSGNKEISRVSGFKPLNDVVSYVKGVYPDLFQ